jgi:hypothetical protein
VAGRDLDAGSVLKSAESDVARLCRPIHGAARLVAEGHSLWADLTRYPKPSTLWRFDGTNARPVFHRSLGAGVDFGEFGYGEPGYAGGASGLWAVVPRRGQ